VGVVTLLTDFGVRDPYVGIMKGVILSIHGGAPIVDITHEVDPQDIREAAFLIPEYYRFFEKGSVHVAVVDPTVGSERRPMVAAAEGRLFVGPDNGIFSLILRKPFEAYEITDRRYVLNPVSATFHGRDIFAPVAAHLSAGLRPDRVGRPIGDPVLLDGLFPQALHDELYGTIVRFDRFGNAITNISWEAFQAFAGERPYRISVGRLTFERLSRTYSEGETACIVGSNGYLEFAVFGRSFREECGAWKGDEVTVRLR
jgi:S-adenosylmethionine hydrolase